MAVLFLIKLYMNQINTISAKIILLLAFLLGTGFLKLALPALALGIVFWGNAYWANVSYRLKNRWCWIAGGLLGLFLIIYRLNYLPYEPALYLLEPHYFKIILIWSLMAFFLPMAIQSEKMFSVMVWMLAFGAFAYALITSLLTLKLLSPPYYGQVIDMRSLARGTVAVINSPGIANLLCFIPIVSAAVFLIDRESRPKGLILIGGILSILAIGSALLLQQRTFFLIVLVVQPITVAILLLVLRRYRLAALIFSLCLVYPGLIYLESFLGITILPRKLGADLLADARVQMFGYWVTHLLNDPWQRVHVGPAPWDTLFWFHNVFADIHRLSGLPALIAFVAFLVVFFARTFWLLWRRPSWGAFVLAVAIPTFMIMNTSVVPEAEKQPFLMMILLYSICECLLWKTPKKLH